MPEALLGRRGEFDRTQALLGRWLRNNCKHTRALQPDAFDYAPVFIAGWRIVLEYDGVECTFAVLIDEDFPYSPIRIAYESRNMYLQWPHVEPGGLLCLPERDAPTAGVERAAQQAIHDAVSLVAQCGERHYIKTEVQREFVSYWDHSKADDARPIRCILDLSNTTSRKTAVWFGKTYTLVGESHDHVVSWLSNLGRTETTQTASGVFLGLVEPPFFPFPQRCSDLFAFLKQYAPSGFSQLGRLTPLDRNVLVMGAQSPSGYGLIGASIEEPKNFHGFRKTSSLKLQLKLGLWGAKSDLWRLKVHRFDPAWVHGRGLNVSQAVLEASSVMIVGCGSLGSQVAVRLAQSGVGGLVLVDGERLAAANAGRHSLGIDSADECKAKALASKLRRQFPHMRRIEDHSTDWEELLSESPSLFDEASLIVTCLGEWSADGPLGEWHSRLEDAPPMVYGWLDQFGTASHAAALFGAKPALSCLLDENGVLRTRETEWPAGALEQTEPACGTLFQPYGPIDVARAEGLVTQLSIDVLTEKVSAPCHRVFAGSSRQLRDARGEWSEEHKAHRPAGYEGPFEYERALMPCGKCRICLANP